MAQINVNLKEEVVMFIGMLVIIAILLAISSEPGRKYRFIQNCTEVHTSEFCEKLWKMGNG